MKLWYNSKIKSRTLDRFGCEEVNAVDCFNELEKELIKESFKMVDLL